MLHINDYPILEFDDNKEAKINPINYKFTDLVSDKLVITFFEDALKQLIKEGKIEEYLRIPGENAITIYKFTDGSNTLITLGKIGCPACAGNLDLFNVLGAKKVMFCGGGGVLDENIKVGQILLVDGAIRDDGFSYHYIKASRVIGADETVNEKIATFLDEKHISYLRGLVWTTDAIFRETEDKIKLRTKEGAKIVEMEQSGCLAVAQFRGFKYGALVYGGDDCASTEWNNRSWNSIKGIRYDLLMLCKELVEII